MAETKPQSAPSHAAQTAAAQTVSALVARARKAQAAIANYSQAQLDEMVTAAGWAIMEPSRNRTLAEIAVRDTGLGTVTDKINKNHRKTLGLMRDLKGAISTGVLAELPELGLTEIARPVGVVAAVVPSTNPASTHCRTVRTNNSSNSSPPQRARALERTLWFGASSSSP